MNRQDGLGEEVDNAKAQITKGKVWVWQGEETKTMAAAYISVCATLRGW